MTKKADLDANNIVEFLADVFDRRGDEEYLGEPVTMSSHMLQCAQFAEENGDSSELIVAALLHDIGHFTSEFGSFSMTDTDDRYHEEAGATLLEAFFPALVIDCIRYHVPAKRYLCSVDDSYYEALSEASVHSLGLQGGPMTDEEARVFEQNPNLDSIITVRRYDDRAKVADCTTPGFRHYAPLLQQVVDNFAGCSKFA